MITVLLMTHHDRLAPYTPYFVGSLYAVYITFETPLDVLAAAEVFLWAPQGATLDCAKIYHACNKRCIFHHKESL